MYVSESEMARTITPLCLEKLAGCMQTYSGMSNSAVSFVGFLNSVTTDEEKGNMTFKVNTVA
jgi:hypothetical protein